MLRPYGEGSEIDNQGRYQPSKKVSRRKQEQRFSEEHRGNVFLA